MKLFIKLIELFFDFVVWIWKKTGINGVLVIAFCIELILIVPICSELESHQQITKNYQCKPAGDPVRVDTSTLPERLKKYAADDEIYYKVTLMVDNHSSMDLGYLSFRISDQNGDSLLYEWNDYYNSDAEASDLCGRDTIPAASSGLVSYYIGLSSYEAEDITAFHILPDDHLIKTKQNNNIMVLPIKKETAEPLQ